MSERPPRFQRRNVGVLADLPEFVQGGAPMPDMSLLSPMQEAMFGGSDLVALANRAAGGAAAPASQGVADPITEEIARQAIADADKYRKQAGTPLNRVLSAVGGVVGAPLNFLNAALGGGDMRQVTAPFRPQQTADRQYQRQVLGIQDTLADIRKNAAQLQASQAQTAGTNAKAVRDALVDDNKFRDGIRDNVAFAAQTIRATETDPVRKELLWNDVLAGYDQNPAARSALQQMGLYRSWSDNLPTVLSQTKDTAARLDPRVLNIAPGGTGVVFSDQSSTSPSGFVQQGTGFVPMGGAAPPASGPPAFPPLSAIDAELKRRGAL